MENQNKSGFSGTYTLVSNFVLCPLVPFCKDTRNDQGMVKLGSRKYIQ